MDLSLDFTFGHNLVGTHLFVQVQGRYLVLFCACWLLRDQLGDVVNAGRDALVILQGLFAILRAVTEVVVANFVLEESAPLVRFGLV